MLVYFCRQLAQQRNHNSFSCYFAHTLSTDLSAFLQSKARDQRRMSTWVPQWRISLWPWQLIL